MMNDTVNALKQQLVDSRPVVSRYHTGNLDHISRELTTLFGERTPQVMLYGAYNAGKSTLVNALLGREEAPMQDIPTTFQVDRYPWNGICLLDTPGVNAPIEHEEATAEQVQKCGLMLFVIREGDQDAKDLYERLFELLQRNKKVFIVLNHQAASEKDKVRAWNRINTILAQLGPQYGIDDATLGKIPVYPVNVATALRGRLRDTEKLLDHCGYTDFVTALNQWIESYNYENELTAIVQSAVNDLWFQPAYERALAEQNGKGGEVQTTLRETRTLLEREKRMVLHSAFSVIQREVSCRKGDVRGAIENSANPSECEARLQTIFASVSDKIESWLKHELEGVSGKVSATVRHLPEDRGVPGERNHLKEFAFKQLREQLTNKDTLTEALKQGRSLKLPMLKGRWEQTLGQWAGRAAIVLQFVMVAYDAHQAGQREDQENRERRKQAISQGQCVEMICTDMHKQMYDSVEEMVTPIFDQQIKAIDRELATVLEQQGQLQQDQEYLAKAISALAPVR